MSNVSDAIYLYHVVFRSQLLHLEKGELEWLSNHLGHTLDIHRENYRIHESTIEFVKVSKLLMAIDSGSVHKSALSQQSLDDMTFAGIVNLYSIEAKNNFHFRIFICEYYL